MVAAILIHASCSACVFTAMAAAMASREWTWASGMFLAISFSARQVMLWSGHRSSSCLSVAFWSDTACDHPVNSARLPWRTPGGEWTT